MKSFIGLGMALIGLSSSMVNAAALQVERMEMVRSKAREVMDQHQSPTTCPSSGGNGPDSRHCWSPGFNSSTDMYTSWPNTGVTVSYHFRIDNTTCSPDGSNARTCLLINGHFPGPRIVANWGDTIRVTVHNNLQHNGTSIHWHGFRQLNTNIQDGVNGITECALAPGDNKTYEFQATEFGTSWFHSHFSEQYGDGIWGTVQINGPATANYDIDLGVMPLTDWTYVTSFQHAAQNVLSVQSSGRPIPPDNILINGTAKSASGTGAYNKVTLQSGKRYRLRLVNTAMDTNMVVNLDGHRFTVIANDFVPVVPFETTYLSIGIGQRYDVVFTANQAVGNYWFRANGNPACQTIAFKDGRAIFSYEGAKRADPTSVPPPGPPPSACIDPPAATPAISIDVPSAQFEAQAQLLPVNFGPVAVRHNLVLWTIDGNSMVIDPGHPTLEYVADNATPPASYNLIDVDSTCNNTWTYWVVQQAINAPPVAHPIHLHGYDFSILGQGTGQFCLEDHIHELNFHNPPRRDVAMLQARGWLVLAYTTNNPGAWLMHCHIAHHVGMGLSLQFLVRKQDIRLPAHGSEWYDTCKNWAAYKAGTGDVYTQIDSGLRKRSSPSIDDDDE
ncbi:laccase, multicopper oxidase, benzenediol:oxygen oxidorectuctase [Pleosporales sp. CAS-2024a]